MEVQTLAQAFQRLLEIHAREEAGKSVLMPAARVRVSERIAAIVSLLSARPSVLLAELIEHEQSRLVIIVTFLAVLEMWKRARIIVRQEALFDSIVLERGERWGEEMDVAEVEE
jgi:segregation and condensation protein A